LPSLDFYGKIILEEKHKIFKYPNGSGGVFTSLGRHKIIREMYFKEEFIF
jgi:UDP-N-acetylglucosamine pyrophosphorylase